MNFQIFIALSIIIIILILFLYKLHIVIYIKNFSIVLICIIFILCLILFSATTLEAAKKGIDLCLNIVFPSLFPFFVGSELLYSTGIVKAIGIPLEPIMRPLFNVPGCASFPFAMGITSGYPVGAKLTVAMRQKGQLSTTEAERLIAFSNNSGPLFIMGAVAVGMYNLPNLGYFLLACHIAGCITVGLIFRFYGKERRKSPQKNEIKLFQKFKTELKSSLASSQRNFGSVLGNAIKDSVGLMLSIGAFIIFFSVIINLLLKTGVIHYISNILYLLLSPLNVNKEIIPALVSGFFEITTGSSMASKAVNVPFIFQLTAASMIIGWAGLSVHSQVLSIVSNSDISIKPYFMGKFLQGCISGFYTFIFLRIAGPGFLGDKPVFNGIGLTRPFGWTYYLSNSMEFFIICIIFLCFSAAIIHIFNWIKRSY